MKRRPAAGATLAALLRLASSAAAFELAGTVRGPDGAPLPGVRVSVHPEPDPRSPACAWAATAGDGSYRLALPAGSACSGAAGSAHLGLFYGGSGNLLGLSLVELHARGARTLRRDFRVSDLAPDWLSCVRRLGEGEPALRGMAIAPGGAPLAGARVELLLPDGALLGFTETDARGRYAAALPEGRCGAEAALREGLRVRLRAPEGLDFAAPPPEWRVSPEGLGAELELAAPEPRPASGSLCAVIELSSRALPSGYAVIRGDGAEILARVDGGRFCASGLAPGRYTVQIAPPSLPPPNRARLPALPIAAESGAPAGGGPSGVTRTLAVSVPQDGPLRLRVVPEPPQARRETLEGEVLFPSPGPSEPALLLAQGLDDAGGRSRYTEFQFRWLTPAAPRFSLPLGPAQLFRFRVRAGSWTAVSLRAPSDLRPGDRIRVRLGPGTVLHGVLRLPDGRPFRPDASEDPRRRSVLSVRAVPYWDDAPTADGDYADANGRYELRGLPPGFVRLRWVWEGESFGWAPPPAQALWLREPAELRLDRTLSPWAEAAVRRTDSDPAPLPGVMPDDLAYLWQAFPRERWLIGLPAGSAQEELASRLLLVDEAPLAFLQDSGGRWRPRADYEDRDLLGARAAPGRYDLYSVEVRDRFRAPALWVLAVERGVELRARERAWLRWGGGRARERGTAGLSGRLRGPRTRPAGALRPEGDLAGFHARAVPRLELRGADGELSAAVFAPLSFDELGALVEAVARGAEEQAAALIASAAGEYLLDGLAPGPAAARELAWGRESRTLRLTLRGGRVETAPDAAAPAEPR